MDIHKEWDQLNSQLFSNQSLKHSEIMSAINSESSSVITKLKSGLKIKSYWCLTFVALFGVLMFFSKENIEQVIVIAVVALIYLVGYFAIYFTAKGLDSNIDKGENILSSLKQNSKIIKRAMSLETGIFLYTSPVIFICSLFYGRLSKGGTIADLINDPKFLITIIVTTIILVPLSFLLGRYLNSKSIAPLVSELERNISKLEGIELVKKMAS